MSELTVAARYAKSLIDLAEEQKSVEEVNGDMELFFRTLKANPELKAVLANPIISHAKKIKVLDEVFGDKVTKTSIAFFKLMINKSRGEVLYTTAQEYTNMYDEKMHIIKANVVSASELSAANKKTIIAELEKATKAKIKLETKVDPLLIGGFILTIGGRQVDTSIANDLRILKKEFAQKVNAN